MPRALLHSVAPSVVGSSAPALFKVLPFGNLLLRLRCRWSRSRFLRKELRLARRAGGRPKRILFSSHAPDWERSIRAGFEATPHLISFDELSRADLSAYDLVVPLTVRDVLALGEQSGLSDINPLPLPDPTCVDLCNDKLSLNQCLIALGFGSFIPEILQRPAPPFILKKRIAENSEHCYLVEDSATMAAHAERVSSPEYFCQRLVASTSEFATHILFFNGRIVTEVTVEYFAHRDVFVKGKESFITCGVRPCPCAELFSAMLSAIGFQGLCCVNYKIENGRPYLLEINPRFGYSLGSFFFSFIRHLPLNSGRV